MNIALVALTASLDSVLERGSYILGELPTHPLAAAYIPQLDAFQDRWFTVHRARTLLEIDVAKARGAVGGADDGLDDFVDVVDRTLLIITKNDRDSALYLFYFAPKTASELKRPLLSEELVTVRAWLPSIQSSPYPTLAALAPRLVHVLAAADLAVEKLAHARQALKEFDSLGPKKELIDGFNALCKSVYGELAVLPHKHPEAMLPGDFADRFFPHESHSGLDSLTNVDDVKARVASLKKDLASAEARVKALEARAEAKAARKEAERIAAEKVAAMKQEEKEVTRKRKAAEKELKDTRKRPGATPPTQALEGAE